GEQRSGECEKHCVASDIGIQQTSDIGTNGGQQGGQHPGAARGAAAERRHQRYDLGAVRGGAGDCMDRPA
ncbi:hypothetical protein C6A85_01960, partial [Mycobacterium sp. ITM-2017-0098]